MVTYAERHDADGRDTWEAVEHAEHRVVEHVAVVDAGTHHDLPVHLDPRVEQHLEPPQRGGAAAVAQELGTHVGIGCMNADVERAQLLGEHTFEIGLGESRERREVPVEK